MEHPKNRLNHRREVLTGVGLSGLALAAMASPALAAGPPDGNVSAVAFMNYRIKALLEAPTAEAAIGRFGEIFEPGFHGIGNGKAVTRADLEIHLREVHKRLKDMTFTVTHAARQGNVIADRHVGSATVIASGEPWALEVMGIYELGEGDRFRTWHEISRSIQGDANF